MVVFDSDEGDANQLFKANNSPSNDDFDNTSAEGEELIALAKIKLQQMQKITWMFPTCIRFKQDERGR